MRLNETIATLITAVSIAIIIAMEFVSGEILLALFVLDFLLAIVLIFDFLSRSCEKGMKYFAMNFYELFAYIPAIVLVYFAPPHFAVFFRALRVIRIIALGIRLMREIKAKSAKLLSSALLLLFITILLSSISFYIAEGKSSGLSFFDCIYWAVVTITTVGYGDVVPSTAIGKLISIITVLLGVSIVSLFTASIVSAVMSEKEVELREEIRRVIEKYEKKVVNDRDKELLAEIRKLLEKS